MINRRILLITSLAITCMTLLVYFISRAVQPTLSSDVNSSIILGIAALFGVLTVFSGFKDATELFAGFLNNRESTRPAISKFEKLEITNIDFTHNAELDVKVRNLSDDAIIINRITILVIKDTDIEARGVLHPTAYYTIPVGELKRGESRSLDVSYSIAPHSADRFLIALNTTRVLKIRVILHCNKDDVVTFVKTTWISRSNSRQT